MSLYNLLNSDLSTTISSKVWGDFSSSNEYEFRYFLQNTSVEQLAFLLNNGFEDIIKQKMNHLNTWNISFLLTKIPTTILRFLLENNFEHHLKGLCGKAALAIFLKNISTEQLEFFLKNGFEDVIKQNMHHVDKHEASRILEETPVATLKLLLQNNFTDNINQLFSNLYL